MTKDLNLLYQKDISTILNSIVVVDMGINGINVLNYLKKELPNEKIVYINDPLIEDYEELEYNSCLKRLEVLLTRVKELNPKLIVVVNDTLIEYGKDKFNELNVMYVNLVDEIIDCVTKNYDSKDMAFFATQGIIEANIYQKNFVYSRLYNLNIDNIMNSLNNALMKTSTSFKEMRSAIMPLYKKEVDVLIPTLPNVMLFKTEIMEFIENNNISIVDVSNLVSLKTKELLKKYNRINNIEIIEKAKEEKYVYIITNFDKKDDKYNRLNKLLNVKFKLIVDKRPDLGLNTTYTYKRDIID